MNNQDLSAFPSNHKANNLTFTAFGLTKREYAAIMILRGMLGTPIPLNESDMVDLPKKAIELTHNLFKQLNTETHE